MKIRSQSTPSHKSKVLNYYHQALDRNFLTVKETESPKGNSFPNSNNISNEVMTITIDSINYQIRPYQISTCSLKIVLIAELNSIKVVDRFDLYVANAREQFIKSCCKRFSIDELSLEEDLYKILDIVEKDRDS